MSDSMNRNERLRSSIPLLGNCTRLEQIHKGYSSDGKYIVHDNNGSPQYILRTYSIDQDKNKRLEFSRLKMMEKHDVKCSRPIAIGVLPEQELGYMLVSFIEGNEASEELPLLTKEEQFNIGFQSGLELKKIHQVICPDIMKSWDERMVAKHNRYRMEYTKCGVAIKNEEKLLSFIDDRLYLMKDRPNLFQHDDYHIGNLIVKDGNLSGIIDFNRYDWGDPIHEFVKIGVFSSEVSVPFSVGQIQGYHNYSEPGDEFWQLYSLYLAMTLVSSIVWVLKVKPDELDSMLMKIQRVMDDHDNFELTVPKWYSQFQVNV
ncbi:Predicted kinase, aminoglycoside phosphotransferase (APT) family [Paenibacillus sp. UNCCL117]|uniref:aminoglycoside phosphotransferase family protein n=1 Tax=unclassified Paenibacillus TaxID=185978 RepID=UPI0008871B2C|nr:MULTISPECIES: aminoglycoside phosphotransferase family protein [unclassified Paenibacillus]SDC26559.1 Predicted kinase, aminoglycoside phosphotransferase (APT) family [Paenibacillus sp. cl123]SFW20122.1 Predicted kinase, aminoglycoside phosphotransferase (APT) family [Paenibacillus sp. UNCCL117]